MDLGLIQRRVAEMLGADPWTYLLWEHDRTRPTPRFVPAIIQFLGYDPFPKGVTFPDRLRAARRSLGLTHRALAMELDVDPSTVLNWERGRHTPPVAYWPRLQQLVGREELPLDAPLPVRLRAYRRDHGITQSEFGQLLGVSQRVIWAWERGRGMTGVLDPRLKRRLSDLLEQ